MSAKICCPADAAHELIAEMHRSPDMIPLYNGELMHQSKEKIKQLYNEIMELLPLLNEPTPQAHIAPTLLAKQAVIDRIKRCCLAYIEERKERLKNIRWKCGGFLPDEIKQNLSPEELEWFKAYNKQISQFQCSIGNGVNLILHSKPPKKLFTQVKVLTDYGEFETYDGCSVMLKKETILSMLSIDCEKLVKRGVVQIIESSSINA
uniref:DNA replication complex GINS protein PSF1 n=1 Tax=Panagrolaimus sp. ES5 TaxID=591445 RepID=A0AC34FHW3_9BILA